jgi:hypothetical protein
VIEARRQASAERMAQLEATRRDRICCSATRRGRARKGPGALDTVRQAIKATELRMRELEAERVPLMNEAEFYKGKRLPPKLKGQIEANDTAMDAQRQATVTQQAELQRVNRIYDTELSRLRRLWSGVPPGSMGSIEPPENGARPAAAASR